MIIESQMKMIHSSLYFLLLIIVTYFKFTKAYEYLNSISLTNLKFS